MTGTKRTRAYLKRKQQRREPHYITCLMVHGPRPESWSEAEAYKNAIVDWWMDSIKSTPRPKTKACGHRFYKRFMAWWFAVGKYEDGKYEVTTVVKEQDDEAID